MGLNIGPVVSAVSALRSAPEFGQARLRGDEAFRAREVREVGELGPFAQPPERNRNEVRAGFGEGTISPLSAALRTLDRTIERVRENQPTIDEIRQQFQARAAERRAEALGSSRDEAADSALGTAELRGGPQSRLIREFAATDAPGRSPILAPNAADESSSAFAAQETRETRRGLAAELTAESRRLERPGPGEVREERLDRVREQTRAEPPRFDVRV